MEDQGVAGDGAKKRLTLNFPLSWRKDESYSGMTIDPQKGFIQWKVLPEVAGTSHHTVSVTDGHGGEVLQSFTLEIRSEKK